MTIAFPPLVDVEAFLVGFLRAAGVDAATRVPNPRVAGMVRVGRVGGDRETGISDAANVLVECWHSSTVDASALARHCHGLLYSARNRVVGGVQVKSVGVSGPVAYPDPDAPDMSRYQLTASLRFRLA